MKITQLKAQVKNPERVSIYVDGTYSFSLSINQLLEEKLKVGLTLTQQDVQRFLKLSSEGKLRDRLLAWTMMRPRSSLELSRYLAQKQRTYGIDDDAKQALYEHAIRKNWVNDEVFASWWLERPSRKNTSSRKLQSELAQKGIRLDSRSTAGRDKEALAEVVSKLSQKTKYQDRQKLMQALAYRGFNYSDIVEALDDMGNGAISG